MTGVSMVHVPYRGEAPALTDLISGQVQVMFSTVTASLAYISTGKLRALAVTTVTRSEALPDVPPVGDFVPGYEVSTWVGIGAPKGTPSEVIDRLNREINSGLDSLRSGLGQARQRGRRRSLSRAALTCVALIGFFLSVVEVPLACQAEPHLRH